MNKKKILLLTKILPPAIGGVPNYYYNLLLNASNLDGIVITHAQENFEYWDKSLQSKGMKVLRVKYYPENICLEFKLSWFICMFKMVFTIIRLAVTEKIDYIIVGQAQIFLTFSAYLNKVVTGKPYILFFHGEEIPQINLKSNFFLKYLYRKAFTYFCNSDFTSRRLTNFNIGKIVKPMVLFPGVEDRFFDLVKGHDIERIKEKLNIEKRRIIYTIARLDERKGQDMVIEALPLIIKKFPDVIYLLGGIGPNENYLKNLINKKNLSEYVKFLGLIPNKEMIVYHNFGEIFIMTNRTLKNGDTEGFGIVFLEANAAGNPVIGGKAGGAIDAIVDNVTGFLVDPESIEDIAGRICWLLENKEKAKEIGKKGRERASREFRWENIGRKFETIVNEL